MTTATLSIELPEGTWIYDVSTSHSSARFRVLGVVPNDERGVALVRITASELPEILRMMVDHPTLVDVEPIQRGDGRVVVRVETNAPFLLLSAAAAGVPIEPPIDIRDGVASVELRGPRDRLSALTEQLEQFGLSYTVDSIENSTEMNQLLTERQRALLVAAVEAGYYDTPRRCTLTELAEEVGVAKSTCSERLHRIEERLVNRFATEHLSENETERR